MAMSEELNTQLLEAAKQADLEGVKAALEAGAYINARTYLQETPLIQAMWTIGSPTRKVLPVAKYLVEQKADINLYDKFGQTAFICAVKNKDLEIVKYLVENGADIHKPDFYDIYAFTIALQRKKRDIVEYLFSRDDFRLSELMPRKEHVESAEYKALRERAIAKISGRIDTDGILYARKVAHDIIDITTKLQHPPLTREDAKMLKKLSDKMSSMDWMNDAQVTSENFDFPAR